VALCCYYLTIADVMSGPQPSSGVLVDVSCSSPTPLASGQQLIVLNVAFTGSNGCPSGTLVKEALVVVAAPVTPTPAITVFPSSANPPPACRAAQSGQSATITTTFAYAVTPAGYGSLLFSASVSSTTTGGSCSATAPAGERGYIFS